MKVETVLSPFSSPSPPGHLFTLPPVIEEMRLNRLEKVKELLEEVEGKGGLQNQLHADKFVAAVGVVVVGGCLKNSENSL